jgi:hypothetical protein
MRPPLVELTTEEANLLATDLKTIGFAMPGVGTNARAHAL